jgi:hypothetical protein
MSPGPVGSHPSNLRVNGLEAGLSIESKSASRSTGCRRLIPPIGSPRPGRHGLLQRMWRTSVTSVFWAGSMSSPAWASRNSATRWRRSPRWSFGPEPVDVDPSVSSVVLPLDMLAKGDDPGSELWTAEPQVSLVMPSGVKPSRAGCGGRASRMEVRETPMGSTISVSAGPSVRRRRRSVGLARKGFPCMSPMLRVVGKRNPRKG